MAKVLSLKTTLAAEEKQNSSPAIRDLEEVIKKTPLTEKAYDRLMIVYRQEKDYKNELRIVNAGIKSFENYYESKKSGSKKIVEISKKLNRSFGFTDNKGKVIYEPEPIARWKKRKIIIQNKINKHKTT